MEFREEPPERRDRDYGHLVSGVRLVDRHGDLSSDNEEVEAGAIECCPSSDNGAFV